MRNTYVFEVLETFSPEELEQFRHFLESPYFNRGFYAERHKSLFLLLEEILRVNPPAELSKEAVFLRLFPDKKKMVAGKLDKLLSEFKKLLNTFLVTQRYLNDNNAPAQQLNLTSEMRDRNLDQQYQLSLKRSQKMAAGADKESMDNYMFQLKVALEEHLWLSLHNKGKGDLNLPEVLFTLDKYYFATRLEMLNRLLLQQKITILPAPALVHVAEPWEIPPAFVKAGSLLHIPWAIHSILKAPTLEGFKRVRDLLQEQEANIHPEHLKEYYTYLRNLCSMLMDLNGPDEIRPVLFQIIIDNLARGYFYQEGKITAYAMMNIVYIALGEKDIAWANAFVERHKNLIVDENETQDFYRIGKALCLFAEKKYEAALEHIPFDLPNAVVHLVSRRLELKIYYEQDSDLLPYKLDAFKMFIRRAGNKTIARNICDMHIRFSNFLRQMSLYTKIKNPERSARLLERIQANKLVAERPWLLEKAEELA